MGFDPLYDSWLNGDVVCFQSASYILVRLELRLQTRLQTQRRKMEETLQCLQFYSFLRKQNAIQNTSQLV